jgi:hypothetical protein
MDGSADETARARSGYTTAVTRQGLSGFVHRIERLIRPPDEDKIDQEDSHDLHEGSCMPRELICPTCHLSLAEGQLVAQLWAVTTCPYCRSLIDKEVQQAQEDRRVRAQDDVKAIEAWLEAACRLPSTSLTFQLRREASGPGSNQVRWVLMNCRLQGVGLTWEIGLNYSPDVPGVCEIDVLAGPAVKSLDDAGLKRLDEVCAQHGVQAQTQVSRSRVPWEGEQVRTVWGSKTLVATSSLPKELLPSLLLRLDAAMREMVRRVAA